MQNVCVYIYTFVLTRGPSAWIPNIYSDAFVCSFQRLFFTQSVILLCLCWLCSLLVRNSWIVLRIPNRPGLKYNIYFQTQYTKWLFKENKHLMKHAYIVSLQIGYITRSVSYVIIKFSYDLSKTQITGLRSPRPNYHNGVVWHGIMPFIFNLSTKRCPLCTTAGNANTGLYWDIIHLED